jgi:hypothetical protein
MSEKLNVLVGANVGPLVENLKVAANELGKFGEEAKKAPTRAKTAIDQLNSSYRATIKDAKNIALAQGTTGAAFEDAKNKAEQLKSKLDEVNSALNNTGQMAGGGGIQKAAGGFNMLGHSVNQLTRELPAFTYSLQTGFMAISNNIPMFVDQIQNIKRANAELIAQGQPVKSVFSQIGSSIFSIQTALSLGVTALTIFGAKMVEAIMSTKEAYKELSIFEGITRKVTGTINEQTGELFKRNKELRLAFEMAKNNTLADEEFIKQNLKKIEVFKQQLEQNELSKSNQQARFLSGKKLTELSKTEVDAINSQITSLETQNLVLQKNIELQKGIEVIKAKNAKPKKVQQFAGIDPIKAIEMRDNLELFRLEYEANNPFDPIRIDALNLSAQMPTLIGEIPKSFTRMTESLGGELNKVGIFFDELGEKIGGWQQFIVSALTNASASFGAALMSGGLEDAGKAMVKMLGGIALQIGAAMIAIGIPMLFAKVTAVEGMRLVAGGIALGIVGGAMQASGQAPGSKGGGGGGSYSGGGVGQTIPVFAGGGQSFFTLDGTVRGQDLVISTNTTRRDNRR